MNRLEAARYLHNNHLRFDNGDGRHTLVIHLTKEVVKFDEEENTQPGLYSHTSPGVTMETAPFLISSWKKETWKSILKLVRSAYPKRHAFQCEHKHQSGARCLLVSDHSHCKKCDQAHSFDQLCHTCKESADKVRLDITRQMAAYYNTYGIPFQKDEDTYDHMTGAFDDYDDLPRSRGDREDFHADG